MSYRPGDHLSVVPRNGPAQVERAMARFGFERKAHVRLQAQPGRKAALPVDEVIAVARGGRVVRRHGHRPSREQRALAGVENSQHPEPLMTVGHRPRAAQPPRTVQAFAPFFAPARASSTRAVAGTRADPPTT